MEQTMGRIIQKLRFERGLTQKKLAEQLHISTQAVSKWECGLGMPDISVIPALASALNISTDVLFGIKPGGAEESITAVKVLLEKNDDRTAAIEAWRSLLQQYPQNNIIRYLLAKAYLRRQSSPQDFAEAAVLYEQIVHDGTEPVSVKAALYMLPFCYERLGDTGNVVRCAKMLDPFYICREVVLARTEGYENKREMNITLFLKCIREGRLCLQRLVGNISDTEKEEITDAWEQFLQDWRIFLKID